MKKGERIKPTIYVLDAIIEYVREGKGLKLGEYKSMVIKDKRQMYSLMKRGLLGNTLRTWADPKAYIADGAPPNVALRSLTQGGPFYQKLSLAKVIGLWKPGLFISEHAPDHALTLQGEATPSPNYIDLFYSTVPGYTMRDGLATHGQHANGLTALPIIKPSSFDCLIELWSLFPNSVVEFSCYPISVGCYPNRNTLFWGVRTTY